MWVPLRPVPPTKTSEPRIVSVVVRCLAPGSLPLVRSFGAGAPRSGSPRARSGPARPRSARRPPAAAPRRGPRASARGGRSARSSPRRRRLACPDRRRARRTPRSPAYEASRSPQTSSSRQTAWSFDGSVRPRYPRSASARRPSHHSTPVAASDGWWDFCAFETFEEPESRPSRTEWTKSASGKISSSPRAEAIVKQLISTSPGLPSRSGPRRSKKSSRLAATTSGRVPSSIPAVASSKRRAAASNASFVDDLVKPALLALAPGAPARADERLLADADAVPPVAPELGQERRGRRRARDDLGEPLRVRVKAALDRDGVKRRMAADQLGHDVRAAAARAADEDEG